MTRHACKKKKKKHGNHPNMKEILSVSTQKLHEPAIRQVMAANSLPISLSLPNARRPCPCLCLQPLYWPVKRGWLIE
jgi:hypothetical protein